MATTLAARRATDVLRYLARHPNELLTLSELADRLELSPGATHGVLNALIDAAFVEDAGAKRYRLGPEAVVLGAAARAEDDELSRASYAVAHFAQRHGLAATVVARRGSELVVLDGAGPRIDDEDMSLPGRRIPLTPPTGAAFLAWSPPHEVLAWLAAGGVDPVGAEADALRAALDSVRADGYLIRGDTGAVIVAAPIVVDNAPPTIALVVTIVDADPDPGHVRMVAEELAEAAAAVARQLVAG
jgi:DNA-binding IclR family transcriptional regulator